MLYALLAGLGVQSVPARADTRDLLDHMERQRQEQREDRSERRERSAASGDERRQARDGAGPDESRRGENRGPARRDFNRDGFRERDPLRGIGPGEAARRAQQRYGGGRVLGVNPVDDGYNVRLLKQGEVRTFMIPEGE